MVIRDATEDDIPAVAEIYGHHVLHGLASFEEVAPDVQEMLHRYGAVRKGGFPYLVAEIDGRVVGYSYATAYRTRSAYRHTLEDSVYVREGFGGRGVGAALLTALLERCRGGPWRQVIAVIGDSANTPSINLHGRLGFRMVGTLEAVGFKFGRWVDSVLMQREI
jgi:L-amino acid N-acyltransferase YncA